MMKWCIIDDMITKNGLETITVFGSKEEALARAEIEWASLTTHDKRVRDNYIVGLCNVEEYEPNCWRYAENEDGVIDSCIYEVAKTFEY